MKRLLVLVTMVGVLSSAGIVPALADGPDKDQKVKRVRTADKDQKVKRVRTADKDQKVKRVRTADKDQKVKRVRGPQ
jgi:hypothetical protein